ncbi:alanine racemase [Lactobacillus paracasei subsp. paracasei]|uniref:alanine racemase n=1 Tax=Lacticaseibacillus paracasei TaxID=1597 RepID=UPI0018C6EA7E|nr:alanine racemase [Lacticaseibacillus paracasei]MBG1274016.1 alanine racemase [Lacticaseibacillus paracasei subsp. paracasei]
MNADNRNELVINKLQLRKNALNIRRYVSKKVKLMCIIKANGYGHGIVESYESFQPVADWFGVATLDEALKIRNAGCKEPVLILGYVPLSRVREVIENELTLCGFSREYIAKVNAVAKQYKAIISMHLKIDTGFNRLGLKSGINVTTEFIDDVVALYSLPNVHFTGIYTHFPVAGSDQPSDICFQYRQYQQFNEVCILLQNRGLRLGLRHCSNSKAMLYNPEMNLDMVRVGIYLYGLGSKIDNSKLNVKPAASLNALVILEKELLPGDTVSYGRLFKARSSQKIGIVALGFADGYFRSLGNNSGTKVYWEARGFEIIGKICMDYLMILLPEDLRIVGQMVEVISDDSPAYLLGKKVNSTAGEILTSITDRVPRRYVEGDVDNA